MKWFLSRNKVQKNSFLKSKIRKTKLKFWNKLLILFLNFYTKRKLNNSFSVWFKALKKNQYYFFYIFKIKQVPYYKKGYSQLVLQTYKNHKNLKKIWLSLMQKTVTKVLFKRKRKRIIHVFQIWRMKMTITKYLIY